MINILMTFQNFGTVNFIDEPEKEQQCLIAVCSIVRGWVMIHNNLSRGGPLIFLLLRDVSYGRQDRGQCRGVLETLSFKSIDRH